MGNVTAAAPAYACDQCEADYPAEHVTDGVDSLAGQPVHLHDYGPRHSDVAVHPVSAGSRHGRTAPAPVPLDALAAAADSLTALYATDPGFVTVSAGQPFADPGVLQLWTDVSEWQGRAYDGSYPHTLAAYRLTLGTTYIDRLAAANTAACHAAAGTKLTGHIGYHVWYPGNEAQQGAFMLGQAAIDQWFVAMIDVESWSGQITGDHSGSVTALATWLAGKLGSQKRVKVYGNGGDLATICPNRPPWLGVIKAGYSSVGPAEPWEAWQYSDGATQYPVPAGWPRASAPFGACDHNARFDTAAGTAAAFGIGSGNTPGGFMPDLTAAEQHALLDMVTGINGVIASITPRQGMTGKGQMFNQALQNAYDTLPVVQALPTADEITTLVQGVLGGQGINLTDAQITAVGVAIAGKLPVAPTYQGVLRVTPVPPTPPAAGPEPIEQEAQAAAQQTAPGGP